MDTPFYFSAKTSAFIITQGSEPVIFYSDGNIFGEENGSLKVSKEVAQKILNKEYNGDTTGCGDNFAGGIIASVAKQLKNQRSKLNLKEAVISGICSGGFACSYHGGTFLKKSPGAKKIEIDKLVAKYYKQ